MEKSDTINNIKKPTERIEWIDSLKGFAIFCVTLGHFNMWLPIEQYIYSFHMFLFFFLSGFLFSAKQNTKEMVVKRVKKLLVPFLVLNTLSAYLGYVFTKDSANFIQELFVIEGNLTWNPPIWFLLVLFMAELIFILFKCYKHTWTAVATMMISLMVWSLIGDQWLLGKVNLVPMALAFFSFGYLFKTAVPIIKKWYIILLAGVGSVYFSTLNIRIVYTYGRFGNYLYCIFSAFCGVIFFVGLFAGVKFLARIPFFIHWGKNSLMIMALQFSVFKGITVLSLKHLDMDLMLYEDSWVSLGLAILTMILISVVVALLKLLTRRVKLLRIIGESFGIQY